MTGPNRLVIPSHLSEVLGTSERWLSSGAARWLADLDSDTSEIYPRKLKALCEIAFLEYLVTRRPSDTIRRALVPALRTLWTGGELLTLWRYNLVHANLFMPLSAAAVQAIGQTAEQAADLRTLAELTRRQRKERLPFRTLDLLHGLYAVTRNDAFLSQTARAAESGCLGHLAFVHDFDLADDYALTHTVFYVTDFGRRPWPPTLAHLDVVSAVLDLLSTRAERDHNLDLLAEYLLARQMLGLRGGRARRESDLLSAAQQESGYWPGPADLVETLQKEEMSPQEVEFFIHYHTTLVAREALLRAEVQEWQQ